MLHYSFWNNYGRKMITIAKICPHFTIKRHGYCSNAYIFVLFSMSYHLLPNFATQEKWPVWSVEGTAQAVFGGDTTAKMFSCWSCLNYYLNITVMLCWCHEPTKYTFVILGNHVFCIQCLSLRTLFEKKIVKGNSIYFEFFWKVSWALFSCFGQIKVVWRKAYNA